MRSWIALTAIAAVLAGCAGRRTGVESRRMISASAPAAPSDEEARRAYSDFRYRAVCGKVKDCGERWRREPWVSEVSQLSCVATADRNMLRCAFVVPEMTGVQSWHLHSCEALFRRGREQWEMHSLIGDCYPGPLGAGKQSATLAGKRESRRN